MKMMLLVPEQYLEQQLGHYDPEDEDQNEEDLFKMRSKNFSLLQVISKKIEKSIGRILKTHQILGKTYVYDGKIFLVYMKEECKELEEKLELFGIVESSQDFHSIEQPLYEVVSPLKSI